uniref:Gem-associated protein 5 TPR domain-containing protein n=1 Tax=Romanomermis culicivorax TaxID=13658 RepID=A0A915JFI9_ROMCU
MLESTDCPITECKRSEVTKFEFTTHQESTEPLTALQDIRDLIVIKRTTTTNGEYIPGHQHQRFLTPSDIFREKPYLRFYGEQKHIMKLFVEEMDAQLNHGNPDIAAILGSACGALPRLIQRAAKSLQLNQFLVALSSSESGTNVKRSCFITYAQTMCIEGDVVKASAFYFGAGETCAAIRCFLKAKCYR